MAVSASSAHQFALRLDRAGLRLLRTHLHLPPVERTMVGLGILAGRGATRMGVLSAAAIGDRGRCRRWLAAGALGPLTILLSFPLKHRVARRRLGVDLLERLGTAPAEPCSRSSHAVSSFASATAMAGLAPSTAGLFFGLPTLISIGRAYLGRISA